ncbi:hypothetical protein G6F57_023738 [Rhizopus arrhizus]|nr:hypothetical protein G6F32_017449 [Rhizopus arrhizus]KAG1418164.1 hypothetical protein G6F57_023738 [Rhizopus arrhizus]
MRQYGHELAVITGIGVLKLPFDPVAAQGATGQLGQGTRDDLGQHGSFLRKMRRQDAGSEGANDKHRRRACGGVWRWTGSR